MSFAFFRLCNIFGHIYAGMSGIVFRGSINNNKRPFVVFCKKLSYR